MFSWENHYLRSFHRSALNCFQDCFRLITMYRPVFVAFATSYHCLVTRINRVTSSSSVGTFADDNIFFLNTFVSAIYCSESIGRKMPPPNKQSRETADSRPICCIFKNVFCWFALVSLTVVLLTRSIHPSVLQKQKKHIY